MGMLNKIWALMILIGILSSMFTGKTEAVTSAALDSAEGAVSLCIAMAGTMALWMGIMEIAKESGLVERLTKGIAPFLYFLFPKVPRNHPAMGYIATNVIANILGLGWACTPAGLKAMEELAQLERERGNPEYLQNDEKAATEVENEVRRGNPERTKKGAKGGAKSGQGRTASTEMCTFLILNISSLQLIPVNMIAYRSQYGSRNPAAILAPAILATLVSTLTAVVYCKFKEKKDIC